MTDGRKDILIITGRYLPGYKDGGPVRSIKNLTDYLGDEYNFKILTCDRDHGDETSYPDIRVDDWNEVGKAMVYYVKPGGFSVKLLTKLASQADLVYVCGCFSDYSINALITNRLGKIKVPVVVAAMGLFSPMEFRIKHAKKKMFTTVFSALGMFKNIYWSATSEMEVGEIRREIPATDEQFFIAQDLPRMVDATPVFKDKTPGRLDVVWISRIAPKKNLAGAIEVLKHVSCDVNFTVYGTVHSADYYEECLKKCGELPSNVTWRFKGELASENVVEELKKYHVFLFPTLGENYGHVIQEALSAGCPCIISDQTPWQDLDSAGVGHVIALDNTEGFVKAVEGYAAMGQEEWNVLTDKALRYACENSNSKSANSGYRIIFDQLTE